MTETCTQAPILPFGFHTKVLVRSAAKRHTMSELLEVEKHRNEQTTFFYR